MMRFSTLRQTSALPATEAAALFIFEDTGAFRRQTRAVCAMTGLPDHPFHRGGFSGKPLQALTLCPAAGKTQALVLIGLGKSKELSFERLRRAAATAAKKARETGARTLVLLEPDPDVVLTSGIGTEDSLWEKTGMALGEGAALSLYRFDRYLSREQKKDRPIRAIAVASASVARRKAIDKGLRLAAVICEGTSFARDLENAPGNEIYPETLARHAASGKKLGLRVRVFDEKKIRALKMGGLLGVGRGSAHPPRFIIMEYNSAAIRRGTIVLVGKGVTFDSGGISIKPSAGMGEMKMDMSGAAAVIATLQTAARLRLPIHLVGLVPAAENMPGGRALKPGDILRHLNGKTSEIDNTDAEGRLILADALSYAARFNPDLVIDLATLTGACVVALGHHATGMLGTDEVQMARLSESGERTYERVWKLPLFEEYEKLIKSDVADVKNTGGRWAGAITAALFLKHFIGKHPWIHLDIAGTAMLEESLDYIPRGGTGVGVRLLIDFLQHWKKP
jgi:leucyl aminopeptidase